MGTLRLLLFGTLFTSLTLSLSAQDYEEFCSSFRPNAILDYLQQGDKLYQIQSGNGISYVISTIDSLGTSFVFDHTDGAYGAKFFETNPNEWELVVADLFDSDVPIKKIALVEKNVLGEISQTLYNQDTQGGSFNSQIRFIKSIDTHLGSYYVLSANGGARLNLSDLTYRNDNISADGFGSRPTDILGSYSWKDKVLSRGVFSEIFTFDQNIKDFAYDEENNYILLEDKIIVLDTLMEIIQDTLPLRNNPGESIQLEVDACCFYVLENDALDRVVRYAKSDTGLFGWLYQETSPLYNIENFRINDDYLVAKVHIEDNGIRFLHRQEKRILQELDKRPQLEFEVVEQALNINSSGSLVGPIVFAIHNTGNLPTQHTGINASYITVDFKRRVYTLDLDTLINPGETVLINDTLDLIWFDDDEISFYMQAADNNPFTAPLERVTVGIGTSSTYEEVNAFSLYPNPLGATQELHYELPFEDWQLTIRDQLGNIVHREDLVANFGTLVLENLTPGVYHCIILANNGEHLSTKLAVGL